MIVRPLITLTMPDNTGAARMAYGFAKAFRDAGHEPTLVHGPPDPAVESILPKFQHLGIETVTEPGLALPIGTSVTRSISDVGRERQSNVTIGVMQRDRAVAVSVARRLSVPSVLAVQNQHRFRGPVGLAAAKRRFYSHWIRRADLAVCTSEIVRGEIESFGLDPARAVVLPNGIHTGIPQADVPNLRRDLGLGPSDVVMLNVGRLDAQKGQDVLLDALARMPMPADWHLLLAGDVTSGRAERASGRFAGSLRSRADELPLRGHVSFLGWRSDVRDLLAASNLFVHAARWEGPALPLAALEAMDSGVPLIVTDCSGVAPGFVPGRHGEVAASGDAKSLAEAISRALALTSPERQLRCDLAQRLVRDQYDIDAVGRAFVGLVCAVVGEPQQP